MENIIFDEQQIQAEINVQEQEQNNEICNAQILQELEGKPVILTRKFFEHLLNCLANQKYLHEMSPDEIVINQQIIDDAYVDGMAILHEYPNHVWRSPVPPQ